MHDNKCRAITISLMIELHSYFSKSERLLISQETVSDGVQQCEHKHTSGVVVVDCTGEYADEASTHYHCDNRGYLEKTGVYFFFGK